jgi:hypothetical protein
MPKDQFASTRAALSTCGAQKQFPISSDSSGWNTQGVSDAMRTLLNYFSSCVAPLIAFLSLNACAAPFLSNPQRSNNQFTFNLNSGPGQYTVQYSSDLVSWSDLLSTNFHGGNASFAFPISPGQFGFYRVSQATNIPTFTVSPSVLNFFDPAFPTPIPPQTFTISNSSPNAIFLRISNNCPIVADPVPTTWVQIGPIQNLGPLGGILYPTNVATVTLSLSDADLFAGTTNFGTIIIADTNNLNNPTILPITLVIAAVQAQFAIANASVDTDALTCDSGNFDSRSAPTNAPADSLTAFASGGCTGSTSASANVSYTLAGSSANVSGGAGIVSNDPGGGGNADSNASLSFTVGHKVSFAARWTASGDTGVSFGDAVGIVTYVSQQGPGGGAISAGSLHAGTWVVGGGATSAIPGPPGGNFYIDVEIRNGPGP